MTALARILIVAPVLLSVESGFSRIAAVRMVESGFSRIAALPGQQLTVWDGVYTRDQSDRGEKLYADRCAKCHGDALQGIESAPALVGPAFYSNWDGETLDALFERLRTSMPQDRPGSLTRTENADILAYMLRAGTYPSGKLTLDPQGGGLMRIKVLVYRPEPK